MIHAAFRALLFLFCATLSIVAAEQDFVVFEGKEGPGKGKHIVFMAGDEEYRSEEALPLLAKILAERHGFKCTVLFSVDPDGTINPDNQKSLSNPQALGSADAIVMLLRFRNYPDDVMKHFVDAFLAGKPIIALRTSTHAFNIGGNSAYKKYHWQSKEWPGGFGKQVLGETWVAHHGGHKTEATRGIIEEANKADPILKGVTDIFGDTDVYTAAPPADAKILVRGQVLKGMKPTDGPVEGKKNDPMQPVVWTRLYKNEAGKENKILTTTMGSATDLANEGLRRIVVNGVYWALDLPVPDKANVDLFGEYTPTMYGFKSYKKGVKPADFLKAPPPPPEPLKPSAIPIEFNKNEKVAFIGNSTGERMNLFGHFEAMLHTRFKDQELIVRNFCFPADEVSVRQRSSDYTKIDDPVKVFSADTYILFFGYNESFKGPEGMGKYKDDYEKFINEFGAKYPRVGGGKPRFILVTPIAFETPNDKYLPNGIKENENLKLYADATADVARKLNIAFVDLFTPTKSVFEREPGLQFTINGAHVNEAGDKEMSIALDRGLFQSTTPAQLDSAQFQKIRAMAIDKSWVNLQDYRMLNGWYVYGGRRTHDHETFPREYVKIRNMVKVRDQYMWNLAQSKEVAAQVDDSKTGDLIVPPTKFGQGNRSEAKELKYLDPQEEIAQMKVPDGFEVQFIASEKEYPALANPVQLQFDNRGRLWVSCMPSYPQWRPGDPRPSDPLLIFDLDENGKPKSVKTFYDKLQCPTGFEFWNGGVLVVDQPRILFLKDTDGDDKADLVVQVSDGWASDDTHHTTGAWEWSNGGLLHMLEGVAMSTTLETPWGPFRNHGSPGAYVYDPLTQKVRRFVTPGYGNPWCYVFDKWGQGICGDGTSAQQHWDSPLSLLNKPPKGMKTVFDSKGMRPVIGSDFLLSRHLPDSVQGQFIYACVINMNGLTRFTVEDDSAGYKGQRIEDLISSPNKHFRPVDPILGPDGAVYFGDWANALIGHMQYSQRDPNRDHTHGRLYRLVAKGRPFVKAQTQAGKPIAEVLEQLKEYEPRTRYRVRSDLRARPEAEVIPAVKAWAEKLDVNEKDYDRLLCEALWIQQGFHAVDVDLLKKVLRTKTPEARAAATRVLADEFDRLPDVLALLAPQAKDEHPRVRLEAIRAASFVRTVPAVEAALEAVNYPTDYWLDYTLDGLLAATESVWKPVWQKKEPICANNPKGFQYLNTFAGAKGLPVNVVNALKTLKEGEPVDSKKMSLLNEVAAVKGNAANGKAIFGRTCSVCHKVKGEGIEFGPDMSDVGKRLPKHELLESVLYPNAKMDARFATTNVNTKDGQALTGFVVAEDNDSVTLKVAGGKDQKVLKADIKKRTTLKTSSMPEGLAEGMNPQEFIDVMEYLSSLK
jgi:putative heme-binding domain-containing protein